MTKARRTVGLLARIALLGLVLGVGDEARAEESRMLATCLPVSQRTGPVGCWIMAQESLGPMPDTPLFWHLTTYPNRAAAEAAKGPGATVMEALDQVWLFTIGDPDCGRLAASRSRTSGRSPLSQASNTRLSTWRPSSRPVLKPGPIPIRGPKPGTTPPGACA